MEMLSSLPTERIQHTCECCLGNSIRKKWPALLSFQGHWYIFMKQWPCYRNTKANAMETWAVCPFHTCECCLGNSIRFCTAVMPSRLHISSWNNKTVTCYTKANAMEMLSLPTERIHCECCLGNSIRKKGSALLSCQAGYIGISSWNNKTVTC